MTSPSLHICPRCASELVSPIDAAPLPDETWHALLRCPDCEVAFAVSCSGEALEALELEVCRGFGQVAAALKHMTLANMAEFADRFSAALEADAILPMDF